MTSFSRILSLPHAFHTFKKLTCASYFLGINSDPNKLILIQSRCLFIKKSTNDREIEADIKKQHDLFQLYNVPKHTNESTYKSKEACSSVSDIMKKIQDDPLNYQSLRTYLLLMVKLYRQQRFSPDFSTEMDTLKKSEEFEKFAQALEKSLPKASIKNLFLMFQAMHYYQIPYSSILMQKLHALILDNINKFELPEVIKMYLIIKNESETLLEPLKNAFSTYMNYLASDSLKFTGDLKSLTYFTSNQKVPFSVREKILKKVLCKLELYRLISKSRILQIYFVSALEFQLADLEPVMLIWLSKSLCSEEFQFLDKTHFLDALKKSINSFQFKDLNIVLRNISNGIYKKVINYDSNMFDIMAKCAVKYDLRAASIIMNNLLRMGHINYELANAVAEKFIESDINSLTMANIERIIRIFGLIDYKNYLKKRNSTTWVELEKILKEYIKPETDFQYLETPLHLFILGLDIKEVVSKAFSNFAKVLETKEEVPNILLRCARLLYQCHCAVYSSPPEDVPEQILSNVTLLPSVSWKEGMYEVFNGEDNVLEKCKTPFGVLISFIAILGPDLKPLSLSSYKKSQSKDSDSIDDFIEIESIPRPAGSKVFAFIECTRELIKFRNKPILRLEPRVITNIHKNLGYRIIHLYLNQKVKNVDDITKILSQIMNAELNYIASKADELSDAEITNTV